MLQSAQSVFSKSRQHRSSGNKTVVEQLLLILSDGRGVFADGSTVSYSTDSADGWVTHI